MSSTQTEPSTTTKLSVWGILGYVLLFALIVFFSLMVGESVYRDGRLDARAMSEVGGSEGIDWLLVFVPALPFLFERRALVSAKLPRRGLSSGRRLWVSLAIVGIGFVVGWLWGGFTFASQSTWYSIGRSAGFFGAEIIFRGLPIVFLLHYLRNRKLALALGAAIGAALMMPALVPAGPPQIVTAAFAVVMGLVLVMTRSILLVAVADLWYVWPKGLEGGQLVAPVVVIGLYVILGWAARVVQRRRAANTDGTAESILQRTQ